MNGDQYTPVFNAAFVPFGLIFRDAHSNQGTGQPSHCASDPSTSECSHDRSSRDEWPKSRYGQSSNAHQPSQGASNTTPVPAPAVAPSGAFVFFSCAKSFDPTFSGNRTEISVFRNPAVFRASTPLSTSEYVG